MTFTGIIHGKWLYDGSKSIDEMIAALNEQLEELQAMKEAGVTLSDEADNDYAFLTTDDPDAAKRFGFTLDQDSL